MYNAYDENLIHKYQTQLNREVSLLICKKNQSAVTYLPVHKHTLNNNSYYWCDDNSSNNNNCSDNNNNIGIKIDNKNNIISKSTI